MSDPSATALRARHLLEIRRFAEAKRILGDALAHHPNDPELHLVMALTHHAEGDPRSALDAAERALALEVGVTGLQLVGAAHRALGDREASLDAYDRALQLAPESARLHVGRALTLVSPLLDDAEDQDRDEREEGRGHRQLAEAARACDQAAQLDPELAIVSYTRGLIALARADLPEAARQLEASLALDPDAPDTHRLLGTVRARQGMPRLASRHWAAAGRLDPQDTRSLSLLRRLARPVTRRARRKGRINTDHVVPAARHILETDLLLRPSLPTEEEWKS